MSRNHYATTYKTDFGYPNRSRANPVLGNQPGISRHVDNRRPGAPAVPVDRNKPPTTTNRGETRKLSAQQQQEDEDDFLDLDRDNENEDPAVDQVELKVTDIDVLARVNGKQHRTDKYAAVENGTLVVRRGDKFNILVTFNRKVNFKKDKLSFIFEAGPKQRPSPSNQWTLIEYTLGVKGDSVGWRVNVKERRQDNKILFSVLTSPSCVVSDWTMTIRALMTVHGRTGPEPISPTVPLYILFNPWNPEDTCYFPDTEDLKEYVLNQTGVIFQGTDRQIQSQPWNFGQFEEGILEAATYCMQRGLKEFDKPMSDLVRVSRAISKIVNAQNDNGVMSGNWSGDYRGGKAPTEWIGSIKILRQYMNTKTPVKFGQCWVFSGLVTTSKNYHCWNEVWMQRPDLGAKDVSGWQVIDATPQEESGGKYQCGPTSVKAIKSGMTDLLYDGYFVFAEVNGDEVHWLDDSDGRRRVLHIDTDSDLDVRFNGFDIKDNLYIGNDFQVGGVMENTGSQARTVEAIISCLAYSYDGRKLGKVKVGTFGGRLNPGQKIPVRMDVKEHDYIKIIDEQANMRFDVFLRVTETQQVESYKDRFQLRRPPLTVKAKSTSVSVGKPFEVNVSFKNTLPDIALSNCYVTIEGPVKESGSTMSARRIAEGEYWQAEFSLTPLKIGKHQTIIISFSSDRLQNITADLEVDVYAN
ncbi:hypothetical protein KUTeg_022667 [Tegillarca granosa]|uniref:Transglutaminase-like domain-containing protein n=1 Tax=Tegillarca granosa TaxID=220873 RepID=A0ABQ9E403_TEGGR|nr:hypothetical protein KUTeg_022667 [Tegillarca granosa]